MHTPTITRLSDAVQIIDITYPTNSLPVTALADGQDGFDVLDGVRSIEITEAHGAIPSFVGELLL